VLAEFPYEFYIARRCASLVVLPIVGSHDLTGFNVLNTPSFMNPNATLTANFSPAESNTQGSIGQITGLAESPRKFQFAARLIFQPSWRE
jgi:hypothetical protein